MPQKKSPDLFELVRGRGATALACLVDSLAVTSKLPSGYHCDLQLLKAPLFRGIDLATATLGVLAHALPGLTFQPELIALDPSLVAAEEGYRVVLSEGIPFWGGISQSGGEGAGGP